MIHIVKFEFVKEIRQIALFDITDSDVQDLIGEGFWLDEKHELCFDSREKKYFIPAHRIYMVIKEC